MTRFFTTKRICRAAVIAALYASLTILIQPIAYSGGQCRLTEALTVLPLFFPEAVPGLTIGCFIANLFSSGNVILDLTLGTSATFLSSVVTYFAGKKIKNIPLKLISGELPPILFNAFIVPFTFLAMTEMEELYFINVLSVGIGQLISISVLGTALFFALYGLKKKNPALFSDEKKPKAKSAEETAGQTKEKTTKNN